MLRHKNILNVFPFAKRLGARRVRTRDFPKEEGHWARCVSVAGYNERESVDACGLAHRAQARQGAHGALWAPRIFAYLYEQSTDAL